MLPLLLLALTDVRIAVVSTVCGMQAVEEACSSSDAARRFLVLYRGAAKQGESLGGSVHACGRVKKQQSLFWLSIQHLQENTQLFLQFSAATHYGLLLRVLCVLPPVQRWWVSRITLGAWRQPARQPPRPGTSRRTLWLLPSLQTVGGCQARVPGCPVERSGMNHTGAQVTAAAKACVRLLSALV